MRNKPAAGIMHRAIGGEMGLHRNNNAVPHADIYCRMSRFGSRKPGVSNDEIQCHLLPFVL